jgi:hypothetical protein
MNRHYRKFSSWYNDWGIYCYKNKKWFTFPHPWNGETPCLYCQELVKLETSPPYYTEGCDVH